MTSENPDVEVVADQVRVDVAAAVDEHGKPAIILKTRDGFREHVTILDPDSAMLLRQGIAKAVRRVRDHQEQHASQTLGTYPRSE